ncbi:MAG: GAF domain-containing protein [Thermoflexales bacterium]|nr:GAF domain-containing protein [Thermoflexales bacterium]
MKETNSLHNRWPRWLVEVPTDDPDLQRKGQFMLIFSLSLAGLFAVGMISSSISHVLTTGSLVDHLQSSSFIVLGVSLAYALLTYGITRSGRVMLAAWTSLIGLEVLIAVSLAWQGMATGMALVQVLPVAAAAMLISPAASLGFGVVGALITGGIYAAHQSGLISITPVRIWAEAETQYHVITMTILLILGVFSWLISRTMQYATRQTHNTAKELQRYKDNLEQVVAERTRELTETRTRLAQRAIYMQTAAEVGQVTASILEMEPLLNQTAQLICERFELYHVGIFLVDATGQWAEYRAGSGEAGHLIARQGLRLEVGGVSTVGWCTANAEARVTRVVRREPDRIDHALLPDTRSEVALPLRSRGRVIGAIGVYNNQPVTFDQDTIVGLQILADQVAVTIDNARLLQQAQAGLEAERRAYGHISREAWNRLLYEGIEPGYRYANKQVTPIGDTWTAEMKIALNEERNVVKNVMTGKSGPAFAVPIKIRDQIIGVVDLRKDTQGGEWTPDEIALLEALTDQLGVALESARLYQDTQRRAAREQLIGEVTAHIRQTLDVETVLKTAVSELYDVLDLDEVVIRLNAPGSRQATEQPAQPREEAR